MSLVYKDSLNLRVPHATPAAGSTARRGRRAAGRGGDLGDGRRHRSAARSAPSAGGRPPTAPSGPRCCGRPSNASPPRPWPSPSSRSPQLRSKDPDVSRDAARQADPVPRRRWTRRRTTPTRPSRTRRRARRRRGSRPTWSPFPMTSATNSSTEPCPSFLLNRDARQRWRRSGWPVNGRTHFIELCLCRPDRPADPPGGRPPRVAGVPVGPPQGAGRAAARPRQERAGVRPHPVGTRPQPGAAGEAGVRAPTGWRPSGPGSCATRSRPTTGCCRAVFPDLKPARPWAAEAFTVARPAEAIGPSVAAFGVGAGSTGARADLLVCDDVVDVRSPAQPGRARPGGRVLPRQPDEPARTRRPVLGAVHPVARRRPERPAEGEPGVRAVPPGGRAGPGAGLAGEVAAGEAGRAAGRDRVGGVRPRLPAGADRRGGDRRSGRSGCGSGTSELRAGRSSAVVLSVDPAVSAKRDGRRLGAGGAGPGRATEVRVPGGDGPAGGGPGAGRG